jgi:monovalent cation:proton antiporter-2 (CPA2) family protein
MEASHSYLLDILALLLATIVVIPFFHAIRLGAILGYLTAGVFLGPWGLGVFNEIEQIRHLGEFGVVFLLFVLGIELKPEKLWQMRRLVLGLGSGQLFISAAVIYGVALLFGLSHQTSIIIGFGLALSSTAFCLKLLAEKGGIVTPMGQKAFSILLMQDLAVVPLLALVSYFAGDAAAAGGHGHGEFNLWYAVGVVIALLLAGRYLLNPILGRIVASQDPEVFIAVAVFLVLGVAWLMEFVGLSMALGAFLAGLMLAESHYRHQIEADIMPFRGLLLGLFFMTVGMGIDFGLLAENIVTIVLLTIGLMLIKATIVFGLTKLIGAKTDMAIQTGVLLSQSGEFGFVMFGAAFAAGLLDTFTSQMLVLIITLSMVFTPFVVKGVNMLLLRFYKPEIDDDEAVKEFVESSDGHVIIAGFGRVGARIAALLNAAGVHYVALDMREERVKKAREQGFPVFFGDASQLKVIQSAGISRAKMLVIALDNTEQVDKMVPLVSQYYPELPIYSRAKDRKHCADLISHGATQTVSESLETSMHLAQHALIASDFSEQDVENLLNEFRDDYYSHVVQKVAENQVVMGELRH